MIICPWCGTNYEAFQSNCRNCGGIITLPEEKDPSSPPDESLPVLLPAPRPVSDKYIWRLLWTDGWAVTAFIFGLLGVIFSLVGAGLTIGIITAFVGIPFLLLGLGSLGAAAGVLIWRYQQKLNVVNVLRTGEATRGQVISLQQNYSVRINHRHPWVIRYQFQVNGQSLEGSVSTLNSVGPELQPGKSVCVLYLPSAPQWNSIYPHP